MPSGFLPPPRILILAEPGGIDELYSSDTLAIQRALSKRGYTVHVVLDLDQAINLVNFSEWDLLIAMSLLYWGKQEIFRRPPRRVRRVALSMNPGLYRYDDPEAADAFLRKPFTLNDLVLVVNAIWIANKVLLKQHVIGHRPQHRGLARTDTFWFSVKPSAPPLWLQPVGGTLDDPYVVLQTFGRKRK